MSAKNPILQKMRLFYEVGTMTGVMSPLSDTALREGSKSDSRFMKIVEQLSAMKTDRSKQ